MARIAVVEDNLGISRMIRVKLTSDGHEVDTYMDGGDALEGVRDEPPELVILDVNLPTLSGFEVAKALREDKTLLGLPILMLTAQDDLESRLQGLEYADDYLGKPFSIKELQARITALLRRSKFRVGKVRNLDTLEGEQVRHYRVDHKLGRGGMSVVYQATDEHLGRSVALKFFTDSFQDAQLKQRFMREARVASRIEHPNVCTVYTVDDTDEGHLFMVMPLLDGETLEDKLKNGSLSLAQALDFGLQIAAGLQAAHDLGLVHRDVKPGNVFITRNDVVKLLDFGIVKWRSQQDSLTKPGTIMGTLSYMSPEQIRGQGVDPRTDVWALGVVLYEMIAGERPFKEGDNFVTVLNAIITDTPALLSDLRSDIPDELDVAVMKALEKDPAERYDSIADFLASLEEVREQNALRPPSR